MNLVKKYLYNLSRAIAIPLVPPELLIISLTECCNLKCITCSIRKNITNGGLSIDVSIIFDIIEQASTMKIKTVVLSGGEPFLVEEIFEIIRYINKLNMNVSVTTNGFYNDKIVERISHSNIGHLHFSFDGIEKYNDEIRGKGSYNRLMRTVRLLRKLSYNQSIGFGTVICSKNCNDLFEMTKIADDLGVNIMNFIPYLTDNIDPQHSKKGREYSILWPDRVDIVNLKNNFDKILSHRYKNLTFDLNPDFRLLMDYYSLKKITKKCFAGYKSMIITALRKEEGKISSDVFFCQDSCGNVYDVSLKRAWNSRKAWWMRLKAKRCNNPCLQSCHYI